MSLTNKLLLLVVSMILLTLLGTYHYQSTQIKHYLVKNQLEWINTLTKSLSESIARDTINGNKATVHELLQKIIQDKSIEYTYVTDMDGDLFAHSFEGGFPRFLAEHLSAHSGNSSSSDIKTVFQTKQGEIIEFDTPLVSGLTARIHVGINQNEIKALVDNVNKDLIWFITVLGLISISIAIIIGKRINLPLTTFTKNLLRFNKNNELAFPEIDSSDPELKNLVHAFKTIIRDRERAEKDLDREQLRLILHRKLSPIGIIEWGTDFKFLDCNPAAEKIFGFTKNELVGHHINENILAESSREIIDKTWKELINNTGGSHSINENTTKDGKIILCEWSNTPLIDDEGEVIGITSYVQDITHQKQQDEIIRRTQKMDALGHLTGGIAHDFNNMLGVIQGYSELLEIKLASEPDVQEYVKEILQANERGVKLTRKLLSFSKQKSTLTQTLSLNKILRDNQNMLEKTLTARIKLTFDLDENIWLFLSDINDLENMILNMSINAMHAMEVKGQLSFKTKNEYLSKHDAELIGVQEGDYVQFTITDTGKGMDDETRERIFEPFYSTKGTRGTGLGLSQVYGVISRSNGAIKVYSEPGHGTQFVIYFPRSKQDKPESSESVNKDIESLYGGTETILVVDDEKPLGLLVREILKTQGYNVLFSESGKQALEILEINTVDLVISDIIMPEMDGYQLAKNIQAHYPEVKIQLVSGFNDSRHVDHVTESLQRELLAKPVNSRVLIKRIRELLDSE